MPIEIDGVEYRTEKQWERVHRHVKKGAKGVYRDWKSPRGGKDGATFYPESQTKPWTQAERNRANKAKREAKAERETQRRIAEAVEAAEVRTAKYFLNAAMHDKRDDASCCTNAPDEIVESGFVTGTHTALAWIEAGFVPLDVARWDYSVGLEAYVCWWWDVRYDEQRAAKLASEIPDEYDGYGLPWWVDRVLLTEPYGPKKYPY